MSTRQRQQPLRVALCQINVAVGDIRTNADRIREWTRKAAKAGAELIVFPELALSGYPPEDLLHRPHFLQDIMEERDSLRSDLRDCPPTLVGYPHADHRGITNSLALLGNSQEYHYDKMHLPNYGVFDEHRYFRAGTELASLTLSRAEGQTYEIGLTICEDIWIADGPHNQLAASGCDIIVNSSASPYHMGKSQSREQMLCQRARDTLSTIIYTNLIGGQDELIFDGSSIVITPDGNVLARAAHAQEELLVVDIPAQAGEALRLRDVRVREMGARLTQLPIANWRQLLVSTVDKPETKDVNVNTVSERPCLEKEVWEGLCLGLRDYVAKTGFSDVIIGISGGVDSALVLALACDALGAEHVYGVTMPSKYNSSETLADAHTLMKKAGVHAKEVNITKIFEQYQADGIATSGLSSENLQARIRGNILMGMSNEQGQLVLACGNKSEMSVGYATLYGDMAGGFNPIKDVPKTLVWRLCEWRNEQGEIIPPSIITRPPSAELAPDQKDTDSLPPYETLDTILSEYVEMDMVPEQSEAAHVVKLVDRAEYKRRQAPPGLKITPKAYGRDRRLPIANRYKN